MKINPISSAANPLLKKIRGLHHRSSREKSGQFLIEGAKVINEALAKGMDLRDVVVSQSFLKEGLGDSHTANLPSINVVEDKQFKELVTTEGPCGILAVARVLDYSFADLLPVNRTPLIVVSDGIQDPGNLGTMMRTALAANATGMVLGKGTVDPYNPKVVRSAAGALFALPFLANIDTADALAQMKERNICVAACDAAAEMPHWKADFTQPLAVVFGNEGQGFTPELLRQCDLTVSIPMNEQSESLNVAISAGIILFSALQQRMTLKPAGK